MPVSSPLQLQYVIDDERRPHERLREGQDHKPEGPRMEVQVVHEGANEAKKPDPADPAVIDGSPVSSVLVGIGHGIGPSQSRIDSLRISQLPVRSDGIAFRIARDWQMPSRTCKPRSFRTLQVSCGAVVVQ